VLGSLALTLLAAAALATVAAIDVTGHWTGTGTERGRSPATLVADLTSSGKTIAGTVTSTQDGQTITCPLTGRQRGRTHLRASLGACRILLQGKFDPATNTISGHYVRHGARKTHAGTFTLTRS
jgi:hypothetical protein